MLLQQFLPEKFPSVPYKHYFKKHSKQTGSSLKLTSQQRANELIKGTKDPAIDHLTNKFQKMDTTTIRNSNTTKMDLLLKFVLSNL